MEGAAGGRLGKLRGTESRLRSENAVSGDGSLGGGKKGVVGGGPGLSWGEGGVRGGGWSGMAGAGVGVGNERSPWLRFKNSSRITPLQTLQC